MLPDPHGVGLAFDAHRSASILNFLDLFEFMSLVPQSRCAASGMTVSWVQAV
jgi:hypothetical protein